MSPTASLVCATGSYPARTLVAVMWMLPRELSARLSGVFGLSFSGGFSNAARSSGSPSVLSNNPRSGASVQFEESTWMRSVSVFPVASASASSRKIGPSAVSRGGVSWISSATADTWCAAVTVPLFWAKTLPRRSRATQLQRRSFCSEPESFCTRRETSTGLPGSYNIDSCRMPIVMGANAERRRS